MDNKFPNEEEIVNPLKTAEEKHAISTEFTNFGFSLLDADMGNDIKFIGTLICNGWDMGRPYKRMRKMKRQYQLMLKDVFIHNTKVQCIRLLTEAYLQDPERDLVWTIAVNIMDPITQNEQHKHNIDKCSNHLVVCFFCDDEVSIQDPLGELSPIRIVTKAVLEGVLQAYQSIIPSITPYSIYNSMIEKEPYQELQEHTCVLWCLWLTNHAFSGMPSISREERIESFHLFVADLQIMMRTALYSVMSYTESIQSF
jgi:hypothetical protein